MLIPVSFFGQILIIDPSIVGISKISSDADQHTDPYFILGCLMGLAGGLFFALRVILVIYGKKEICGVQYLFYFYLGSVLVSSLVNIQFGFNNMMSFRDFQILLLVLILGLLWNGSQIYVANLESSALINGLITNMSIVWGFLQDIFIIGIPFEFINGIGCVLVAGTGFFIGMT